jgi:intron-binding protein aquarius
MEWENTREHDVFFLLTVRAPKKQTDSTADADLFELEKAESWVNINREHLGIVYIRGCEVKCVLDEHKKVIGQRDKDSGIPYVGKGNIRTYRVLMDTAQYQLDTQAVLESESEDPYTTFNLLMRRNAKENNFKVLFYPYYFVSNVLIACRLC